MSETVTTVQPDKAAMEKINLYTRRAYKPEEVYTFSVVLCDNEVDRDGECFTKETLEELAKLFVGKTGILDHEPTSKNQTARVFDAAVKEIPGKVTSLNEPYAQLTAQAYVPRNDGTKAFIESIESGIRKEVSVGCAVKKRVCSVCGAESCVHVPGKTYNGKRCVRILSGAADAYEFSFVAVPAQRAAGVCGDVINVIKEIAMTKELLEQYPDICAEIEELKAKDDAAVSDVVQASADEFPFNLHSVTVQGMPVQRYTEQIERLKAQKTEIEQFVFHLPNPTVRRIVMLRAWHGYSWDRVAAQMSKNGKSLSEQTLKKKYYGIFGK